jgi:hypothetical protein
MKNKFRIEILTICGVVLFNTLSAQNLNSERGKIGITFSTFGKSHVTHLPIVYSDSYHENNYYYSFGVNYIYPLNSWLVAETGIEYSKHNVKLFVYPDGDTYFAGEKKLSLINIPLTLRVEFLKFFFVNAGTFFDFDISNKSEIIDNQTGMGIITGLGMKYDFKMGISLYANPFLRWHNLIPFVPEKYPDRLLDSGIRIGITYDLRRRTEKTI